MHRKETGEHASRFVENQGINGEHAAKFVESQKIDGAHASKFVEGQKLGETSKKLDETFHKMTKGKS